MNADAERAYAYAIPHLAIHTGRTSNAFPIDVEALVAEVIHECPIVFPRMTISLQRRKTESLHTGMMPADQPTMASMGAGLRPMAERNQPVSEATYDAESQNFFSENRARLLHPPVVRSAPPWKRAAMFVTVAMVLMCAYLLYVEKTFNGILPPALQYRHPSHTVGVIGPGVARFPEIAFRVV